MNERIKEIAVSAKLEHCVSHVRLQDFAELIICECIGVVDSMSDPDDSERYFWAIQNASEKIKQHFGVEE